jgi:hypothetical protein
MLETDATLSVRQHARVQCRLPAAVTVAAPHAQRVALTAGSGEVRATLTDLSAGGLGLRSPVFFPKGCLLDLALTVGDGPAAFHFRTTLRVQRTIMADRAPSYDLGAAFANPGPELDSALKALREHPALSASAPAPHANPGAARA